MNPTPRNGLRAARLGLVAAALLVGAILVTSSLLSLAAVKRSTDELILGQATVLLDGLQASLREDGGTPNLETLNEWFLDASEEGVTYAGLGRAQGMQVGTPSLASLPPLSADEPFGLRMLDGKVRAERQRVRNPRPGRSSRVNPGKNRAPLAHIVVEFVPLAANRLIGRARRQVVISLCIALGLLVASGIAYRWLAARERLDKAQSARAHLAHLGEMSAVIAHELRNPLASLKGHAELLAESLADERAQRKAARVVAEAQRIEHLITDLLAFARTGAILPTNHDPRKLAREAAERVGTERIELETGTAPSAWSLDGGAIGQVLLNLLQNALEASPDQSKVTMAVTEQRGTLSFTVRDRGPGIAPERLGDLFEPFVTTRTRGTGLGLAVARRLVEAHGGSITASNHESGGAVFVVNIPRDLRRGNEG